MRCEDCTECRAFSRLCTYNRIWIPKYAIVAGPLFRILRKDIEFPWETEEKKAMAILKEALCNATALKTFDVTDGARQIVVGVDASLEGWGQSCNRKTKIRTGTRVCTNVGSGTWLK
jgi:hypothetical protein